jgi:hypothetical protein
MLVTTATTRQYNEQYRYHYYLPDGIDEQAVVTAASRRLKNEGEKSCIHSHKYGLQCDGYDHREFNQETLDDWEKRNAKASDKTP